MVQGKRETKAEKRKKKKEKEMDGRKREKWNELVNKIQFFY